MWIKIKWNEIELMVNSKEICFVRRLFDRVELCFDSLVTPIWTNGEIENNACFNGFQLALNGLDFVCEGNYIKPLLVAKNEILYRHIMLKEVLSENK